MSFTIEDTKAKVLTIIADKLNMPKENIAATASFKEIGADSLDIVEIIMSFEEAFGVEIKDEDAEKIKTVDQAVTIIHEMRAK